jgi:membrane protein implicated in regulation of membrane protease activity
MGFYYGPSQQPPPDADERPPGCFDAILITRAVLGILFPPIVALLLVVFDIAAVIWLLTIHPALALIPIALTAVAVWLFARWDQRRERPPADFDG